MDELRQEREEEQSPKPPSAAETEPEEKRDDDEEAVEWDGSEAELVLDDDAADYEEPHTGIKLSYKLREKEVFRALEKSGFSKTLGKRALVEGVILVLLAVFFFVTYARIGGTMNLFFGGIAVLALAAVALLPYLGRKKRARDICRDERLSHIEMEIYPDSIQIGHGEGEWEIPLDGSCRRDEHHNLLLFFPAGKRHMVILPLRCIEPGVLPEVQAMIVAGTHRGDEL